MGMAEYPHWFWDAYFGVLTIAVFIGIGVWFWKHDQSPTGPHPFWRPLGYAALVLAMSCGAQIAGRGMGRMTMWHVLLSWAFLVAVAAALLGVRHLLSRRNRGKVSG